MPLQLRLCFFHWTRLIHLVNILSVNVNIYLGIGHLRTEIKRRKRRRRERRRRGGKERGGRGERVVSIFSLVEGNDDITTIYFNV